MNNLELVGSILVCSGVAFIFGIKLGINLLAKALAKAISAHKPEMMKDFMEINKAMRGKK